MLHGQLGADVIALLAMAGSLLAGRVRGRARRRADALGRRAARRARIPARPARVDRARGARPGRGAPARGKAGSSTCRQSRYVAGDRLMCLRARSCPWTARCSSEPRRARRGRAHGRAAARCAASRGGDPQRRERRRRGDRGLALRPAAASTYARIVHLVERAEADRPRTARLADRAAVIFLPITLAVAGLGWVVSGSPVAALAVLVVATPCPLILATPIAFVSGLARAARRGIVVKGGTSARAAGRGDGRGLRQDRHAHDGPSPGRRGGGRAAGGRGCRRAAVGAPAGARRSAPRPRCGGSRWLRPTASTRRMATASRRASAGGQSASAEPPFVGGVPDRPAHSGRGRGVGVGRTVGSPASSAAPIPCAPMRPRSSTRARGGCAPGAADGRRRLGRRRGRPGGRHRRRTRRRPRRKTRPRSSARCAARASRSSWSATG